MPIESGKMKNEKNRASSSVKLAQNDAFIRNVMMLRHLVASENVNEHIDIEDSSFISNGTDSVLLHVLVDVVAYVGLGEILKFSLKLLASCWPCCSFWCCMSCNTKR